MARFSVQCPSCDKRLAAQPDMAGRLLACPACGTRFRVPQAPAEMSPATDTPAATPTAAPTPPPPPLDQPQRAPAGAFSPSPPAGPVFAVQPQTRLAIARRQSAPSKLDIAAAVIDWRFQQYLTPWIIRGAWILALVAAALYNLIMGAILLYAAFFSGASERPAGFNREMRFPLGEAGMPTELDMQPLNLPEEPDEQLGIAGRLFRWVFAMAVSLGATILVLLLIRVYLEVIVVLFNIAATLTAMQATLGGTGSRQQLADAAS